MAGEALGKYIDLSSPRGYYLDYSAWAESGETTGVGGAATLSASVPPATLARAALGNLELYLGGAPAERRDCFARLIGRIIDSVEQVPGGFAGWAMPAVPRALRGQLEDGWFSASTHAECVCALVRAESLMSLKGARETAARAFGAFATSVEDGGFLHELGDAGDEAGLESLTFIEEYPAPGCSSLALGSHVRGLWAIFDFGLMTGDSAARSLFLRCVRGLCFVLDRYDLGYWTAGNLDARRGGVCPATPEQHGTHVRMMRILADMTGEEELGVAGSRWEGYSRDGASVLRARLGRVRSTLLNLGRAMPPA